LLGDSYALLDSVGAVDAADAERLRELGVRPDVIEVTGDTRFDQVWQRAQAVDRSTGLVARLTSDRATLVAGSTWPADEAPLLDAFTRLRATIPALRLIIAPHENTADHVGPIEYWAKRSKLSIARVDQMEAATTDVVLVDRFGVLGDLYALATVAFVGGGFHSAGLHSVLEPAAFGAPVLFGPQHKKSRDAAILLEANGAASASDSGGLERQLSEWLTNSAARADAGARALGAIERGKGAAERSLRIVERLMLL
jgi:3-deoxy-D-manno-octulosonic-acid transferase